MNALASCPMCGAPLTAKSPQGLCPACLLKTGLESRSASEPPASAATPSDFDPGLAMTIEHVRGSVTAKPLPERPLPEPGETFGGYKIVRTLGKGGMGAVFEADQLETGRRVALKVLKHSLDSPEARKRFLREGRLAASINHPNSVYVYGTEEIEGTPAIAMELVAGGTLQEQVKKHGPLAVGKAVDVILQIVAGLAAAQKLGVLHRDIKPANCFVDADGSVKVGDFGLSISTAARDQTEVTQSGAFLGTPAFSSPEQLRGDELNVRSDMYSVGVTLYYLLTGRTPFEADNVVKLLATVLEQPAQSPRKHRPGIPAGLANVVLRCLQKQPTDRFKDYADLRQALQPFASASPTPATLGLRWVAHVVDCLLLAWTISAAQFLLVSDFEMLTDPARMRGTGFLLLSLGTQVFRILYFAIPEGLWGQTPGRVLCRLKVVGPDRTAPGIGPALVRAAIFCLLPAIPHWINYLAGGDPTVPSYVAAGFSWAIFLGLFATARRSNGYAGLHELASGTRVISHEAYQTRPSLATADELPAVADNQPTVGPYHVLKELGRFPSGTWLLGYDTRLLRRVWIHQLSAGAAPVVANLRSLGRVGRLRWLNSRRSTTENWDAYEAVPGKPLVALLNQKRPWREVRFWIHDLAEELATSAREASTPGRLSADQVWITADGRAKLLDFPAPGVQPLSAELVQTVPPQGDAVATRIFLDQIGTSALEGRPPLPTAEAAAVPAVPLPIPARKFFESLPSLPTLDAIVQPLRELIRTPAEATFGRRLTLLLALALPGVVLAALGFGMARVYDQMVQKYPEIQPLMMHLVRLDHLKRNGVNAAEYDGQLHPGGPASPLMIEQIEKYIAHRFGAVVRDKIRWNSIWARNAVNPQQRKVAEEIVARYPQVSGAEFAEAEKLVKPLMGPLGKEDFRPLGDMSIPLFACLAAVGWLMQMALLSICAAALCRGGLLLWSLGLTFVRSDGKPASRLRLLWRALVAWSPLVLIPIVPALILPAMQASLRTMTPEQGIGLMVSISAVVGALYLTLVVWSALLQRRGIPDRLAGTWLVPR